MYETLLTHAHTDTGLVHRRNEDSYSVFNTEEGGVLLLVCDGMGGMGRGDEASRIAVDTIIERFEAFKEQPLRERFEASVLAADDVIRDKLCNSESDCPGSTAAMAYIIDGKAHLCWVGDSRAYVIRGDEVLARTRDHKLVQDLIDAGQMTPDEAKQSRLRSILTNSLGARLPGPPAVEVGQLDEPIELKPQDRILVCSDGLVDLVPDDELPDLLVDTDVEAVAKRLIDLANERGGHDNITALVGAWEVALIGSVRFGGSRKIEGGVARWSASAMVVMGLLVLGALSVVSAALF